MQKKSLKILCVNKKKTMVDFFFYTNNLRRTEMISSDESPRPSLLYAEH